MDLYISNVFMLPLKQGIERKSAFCEYILCRSNLVISYSHLCHGQVASMAWNPVPQGNQGNIFFLWWQIWPWIYLQCPPSSSPASYYINFKLLLDDGANWFLKVHSLTHPIFFYQPSCCTGIKCQAWGSLWRPSTSRPLILAMWDYSPKTLNTTASQGRSRQEQENRQRQYGWKDGDLV